VDCEGWEVSGIEGNHEYYESDELAAGDGLGENWEGPSPARPCQHADPSSAVKVNKKHKEA